MNLLPAIRETENLEDAHQNLNREPENELTSTESRREKYRQKLRENQTGQNHSLLEYLKELLRRYETRDSADRDKRARDIAYMCRYYDGDMFGDFDDQGEWQEETIRDGDTAYSVSLLKPHVDSHQTLLLKTRIEYEYQPAQKQNAAHARAAKMCQELAAEEWKSVWTEWLHLRETLQALLTGEAYRRLNFIVDESGKSYRHVLEVPNTISVQPDFAASNLEDSSFVILRDELSRKYAEFHYQMIVPQARGEKSVEQTYQNELERATVQQDSAVGSARELSTRIGRELESVSRVQAWIEPHEYADFYLDKDETLPDGSLLEAGTFLGDAFPDGMFLTALNGEIAKMQPRALSRVWSKFVIGMRPASGAGSGLQHIRSLCDLVNDAVNLKAHVGFASGHPIKILDGTAITTLPGAAKIMIVRNLPAGKTVGDLLFTDPGAGTHPIVESLISDGQGLMQFVAGTVATNGNSPEIQEAMGTATGVTALTEMMNGRSLAAVLLRKQSDIDCFRKILKNIRQFLEEGGDRAPLVERFGADAVDCFLEMDFERDLIIEAKKGTDQPQSAALTLSQMMMMAQVMGAIKDAPYAGEIMTYLGELINLPVSIVPGGNDKRNAEYRLAKLKDQEKALSRTNPNYTLRPDESAAEIVNHVLMETESALAAIDPQAPVLMFDHRAFVEVYKDWLMSEAGLAATPVLREAVSMMWQLEFERIFEQEMLLAQKQQEIAQKLQEQQMAQQIEQQAQAQLMQGEQAAAAGEDEMTRAAVEYEAEESAKDADHDRALEQREHDAALTMVENQAAAQNKEASVK